MSEMQSAIQIVSTLLGIGRHSSNLSVEELAWLSEAYEAQRDFLDGLYTLDQLAEEEPQAVFYVQRSDPTNANTS